MKEKVLHIVCVFSLITGINILFTTGDILQAHEEHQMEDKSLDEPLEFNNKLCPVSNEMIKEKAFKYEYKGVVYNLCCKMCIKDFKRDPENYIQKLKNEREKNKKSINR